MNEQTETLATPRRLLWVKGKAGLGNRMLSALTGILYARITGRQAVIDWRDGSYSDDGTNSFPKLFTSPYVVDIPPVGSESVAPALWTGNLHKNTQDFIEEVDPRAHGSFRHHWKFSTDLSRQDQHEDILVMWSFSHLIDRLRPLFRGEFAFLGPYTNDEVLRWLLQTSLALRPEIQSQVEDWFAHHLATARTVIGVHVRFMDRSISLHHFIRHLDRLLEKVPDATIFLATDNAKVSEQIQKDYRNVVSTAKWFPQTGISMHQNPECPDKVQNAIDALRDMYLLARCDYLVYPRSSTFSYISSLVSAASADKIVDVERFHLKTQAKRWVKEQYLKYA